MTTTAIDFSKMTAAEAAKLGTDVMLKYIEYLENAKAEADRKAAEAATFAIKIGRSGTVSITGFGRYGISLYDGQWDALIPLIPAIQRFRKAYAKPIAALVAKLAAMTDAEREQYDKSANEFKPLKLRPDSVFTEQA